MTKHPPQYQRTESTDDQRVKSTRRTPDEISPDDVLDVLGDEYTQDVLQAVLAEPRSGAAVAEHTDVSEPTAFRRLNKLAGIGFVETTYCVDPEDGHHHKQYRAVISKFTVTLTEDGPTITFDRVSATQNHSTAGTPVPADD